MRPFKVFDLRVAVRENGYDPVPAQGKDAYLEGWQIKRDITREEMASWSTDHPKWSNTGTQTGPTPAFDVDITHTEAAAAVHDLVRDWFDDKGTILTRYGEAPKFAILFRTEQPFEKIRINFIDPANIDPADPKKGRHHIEVLGAGQQIIIDGIHPVLKKPYTWHADRSPANVPRSDLPETNEAEMRELVQLASDVLCERFGFEVTTGSTTAAANGGPATGERTSVDVDGELADIHYGNINDTWSRVMGSLLRDGTPADDIFIQILTATQNSPACQSDPNRGKWTSSLADMMMRYMRDNREFVLNLSPHAQVNWETVLALKKRPALVWSRGKLQVRGYEERPGAEESADDNSASAHASSHEQPKFAAIEALPFVAFNPAELAAREWLYGNHYQRAILTATVGAGGGGKSSLGLVELIAMCTARNLLGEQPLERCRVWYHNAEETITELYRRIAAVCQHYRIPQSELEGWLFVTSGIEMPIKIATNRSGKLLIDATATEAIIRTIAENGISVSCFDPLIAHHTGVENVTGDMDQILREFARIAYVTDCSTEIVHHTRKPAAGQEELSVYDSRGAGAIKDAVRSMRVLNTMSKAEADKVGIDDVDRLLHFRIDRGKANMVPPTSARWRRFLSVDIANGDNVGVVTEWTYPTEAAADIPDAVCVQVQTEVGRKEYRAAAQSPDWIGKLIGRLFRLDISTRRGKTAANRYLEVLYNKGVITVADGDTGRHRVSVVVAGTWRVAA